MSAPVFSFACLAVSARLPLLDAASSHGPRDPISAPYQACTAGSPFSVSQGPVPGLVPDSGTKADDSNRKDVATSFGLTLRVDGVVSSSVQALLRSSQWLILSVGDEGSGRSLVSLSGVGIGTRTASGCSKGTTRTRFARLSSNRVRCGFSLAVQAIALRYIGEGALVMAISKLSFYS